jgi:F0F1-type ATP synthase epsilon subunit
MNNPQQTIDTIEALSELIEEAKRTGEVKVTIQEGLLEIAHETISVLIQREEMWKSIAEDFAKSINVTQGESKPRFNIDLELFLSAQKQYENANNDLQQTL